MSRPRHAISGFSALAAAGLLLVGPAAHAQDSGSASWSGSSISVPSGAQDGLVHVEAYFTRDQPRSIRIIIQASGSAPAGCSMPGDVVSGSARTPTSFGADLGFGCNGSYSVTAIAETTDDNGFLPHDEATRSGSVSVAMPAPTVTGVGAVGAGRSITVTWNDMRYAAADLSGYIVERQIDNGSFTQVGSLSAGETSFTDTALPAQGGAATYRVSSTRPSPDRRLTSQSSSSSATPFVADQSAGGGDGTTPGTTPGGGSSGDGSTPGGGVPGDGSTPGTTAGGGTTPGSNSPGPSRPGGGRPGGSVATPRLGISGSFLPPLLRPSVTAISDPSTLDDGFEEALPYGDAEPGAEDPVLPDDELASLFSDGSAGRGMIIPVATALVLAVWAFHLRFLARISRPVD